MIGERYEKSKLLFEKGKTAYQEQRYSEALKFFEGSLDEAVHYKTLELMGYCCVEIKQMQKAIVFLAAASCLNPSIKIKKTLVEVLCGVGEYFIAETLINQLASKEPNHQAILSLQQQVKAQVENFTRVEIMTKGNED